MRNELLAELGWSFRRS